MNFNTKGFSVIVLTYANVFTIQSQTLAPTFCAEPCQEGFTCSITKQGSGPAQPACIPKEEALLLQRAVVGMGIRAETMTTRKVTEIHGKMSAIMEDNTGRYYFFYPRQTSDYYIRVNISKHGFCNSHIKTTERNACMNTCYADRHCMRDLKCCPSGCSLGCTRPADSMPIDNSTPAPRPSTPGTEPACTPCADNTDCKRPGEYCYYSPSCAQQICQKL